MFAWLKDQAYNIILLQETHSTSDINKQWTEEWGNSSFFSGNKSNSQGIGILINEQFNCEIVNHTDIFQGRLQALEVKINDKDLVIIIFTGQIMMIF